MPNVTETDLVIYPKEYASFDGEHNLVEGQPTFTHNTVESFQQALQGFRPDLVLTFSQVVNLLFTANAYQNLNFVDANGCVHAFTLKYQTSEEWHELAEPAWTTMKELGLSEADGMIKVSEENGDVFISFQTDADEDSEDYEERYQQQVDAWVVTCSNRLNSGENSREAVLQYIMYGDEAIIADLTLGKQHYVTILRLDKGHTLDFLQSEFPRVRFQDNLPTLQWARQLNLK
ncbi:MAG: hypothetical protein KDJ97_39130 [Anaerolineae bacterium]|nr:hypothetical protein [Anaerolineae bacterium]